MTYDVAFVRRNGSPISFAEFRDYFEIRPHYKIEGTQAAYENNKTGVYFLFEHGQLDAGLRADLGIAVTDAQVSFNLNFWRPHIFGLEAEPEVGRFCRTLRIGDSRRQRAPNRCC